MSKFFKGLASSGAWCCFDEFNRIDLEVLSVVAQQVLTIQTAVKAKSKRFWFDGEEIDLIPTCTINITMNPGYAGRSELPDNLKALFRPCAMMVPNYSLISEIFLYSVGFQDAKNLARKIVASLQLSSEQLSSQFHYDFGMRALKAILTACGNLKRIAAKEPEDIIVLQSLMDVNLPKFTKTDIPLFMSITSDLFPTTNLPPRDYKMLLDAITLVCDENNWQPEQEFISKNIQLYDTIMVRHGLMLVGDTCSGKTTVLHCLQKSMTKLDKQGRFNKVAVTKMNPKSITSHQLYGLFDPDTRGYTDGVMPIVMRECAADGDNAERKWVTFDGPVDAVWIENMNTVLDDNKKLCLTSGEIIKLTPWMTMIFEVEDLSHASPATVSRCGMVFLEAKNLGWNALVKAYFRLGFPQALQPAKEFAYQLCKWFLDPTVVWCRKYGKFPMQISEMAIVMTFLRLFDNYLSDFKAENAICPKDIEDQIQNFILFGLVWSLGAALEEPSRPKFHQYLMELIGGENVVEKYMIDVLFEFETKTLNFKLQDTTNIYEMYFDNKKLLWLNWMQTVPAFRIPKDIQFHNLLIPTVDSVRNNHFVNLYVSLKLHLLMTGPTGTGKTLNVINEINANYYNAEFTNLQTSFSGQTTSNQIQKAIEAKMPSKRRKGVFGPEDRKARIVIFIDDINMPKKETYMAQPPIELLRQWMDEKGWYDLETMSFKYLEDMTFIGAMGPPSQGRNTVTLRFSRHFNLLYVEPFEAQSLTRIFGNVLEWYFMGQGNQIMKPIQNLAAKIVASTVEVYNTIKTSKELLPTPTKSHYQYNLRDISKVFQGISRANHHGIRTDSEFIKLWAHECMRVFQDRLINEDDQNYFQKVLSNITLENFKKEWKQLVQQEPLLFSHFVPTVYPGGDTSKKQLNDIYCELDEPETLKTKCYEFLNEYNQFFSANRMDLVLFMNAIQHVLRIVRIITTAFGHALLVGVGGSGRKSLATLSCYIANYDLLQVDQKIWVEELQRIMKIAGLEDKQCVFLFTDTQIMNESMVEDICNILNNGQVPNLFPLEERAKIVEEVSTVMPVGTMNQKYAYFLNKCKENLHLVLCMSPVGEALRARIRTFPGLVNCTTIDWFLPWPEEALQSTARSQLTKMDIKGNNPKEIQDIKEGIVNVCVDMQLRVRGMSERFYAELRRFYYVTPTSYLELLATFQRLHIQRTKEVQAQIQRYENGVEKIKSTEVQVEGMQKQLTELQPVLEVKSAENVIMLKELKVKQDEAAIQKAICEKDEAATNIQREEATALKTSCEADLNKVLPLLAEAAQALEKIKPEDITTMKSFVTPPPVLDDVMKGVILTLGLEKDVKWKPKEPGSMEKVQDFWDYAKKFVLNSQLIKEIKAFKESNIQAIPPKIIKRLKDLLDQDNMQKEKVMVVSQAAGNMSVWIRAVTLTYDALLIVEPKRLQLAGAQEQLAQAEAVLAQKQAALKAVMDLLKELEDNFNVAKKEKDDLEAQVIKCEKQLKNATELIEGLGGEKTAWTKKSVEFKESEWSVTGDILLSSGIIAYLGAFMINYREECLVKWQELLKNFKITYSPSYSLQTILSDAITIGAWTNTMKLPNDSFSVDNAIILKNSTRWPLLIDPQIQAKGWLIEMEKNNQLVVVRQNQSLNDLTFKLENAIQFGLPVLLENIESEIDSIFEPILQQKKVKQGNSWKLKFGEKTLDYSDDFRFYITTKLSNPHYPPEICVKVTLLNFMVTPEGLEDQMLNIIVKVEEPIKEEQKNKNIKEFFENRAKQKATEDKILKMLNDAEGNILDDDDLIATLKTSKIEGKEIEEKLKRSIIDQEQFQNIRNNYKDAAKRSSNLFFVVMDMALVEPVYQFSLEFYIDLFQKSIDKAVPANKKDKRVQNINSKFTQILYENLVRSLLEKDKLLFSFLLCIKILQNEKKVIDAAEIRYLMVGGTATSPDIPNPAPEWLSDKSWANIIELSNQIPCYKGFSEKFAQNIKAWENIYQCDTPQEHSQWPQHAQSINSFQKLCFLRLLRPDRLIPAIQNVIVEYMDPQFVEFPPFDLQSAYDDANERVPLIFILSTGADPSVEVQNLAVKLNMKNNLKMLSLGQGQGGYASAAIAAGIKEGHWVFLQNCHLAASWMPELEKIHENLPEETHKDFRLWLTTAPSNIFPVPILQKGVKMTYEPPKGIKNSLMRSYLSFDLKQFEGCEKPREWKKLLFGLSFFHALALERRKFGPLGWNIPYEFSANDLLISVMQLKMFLDEYDDIPWAALNYMVAEANYGGRVTDDKDRKLICIILKNFYTPKILEETYKFSISGSYYSPEEGPIDVYKEYIKSLPRNDDPECFGMHNNAAISASINDTNTLCETILSLLPRSTGGAGQSPEDIMKIRCSDILARLPKVFNNERVSKMHPVTYEQSMNTVLQQELIRFNKMIVTITKSLDDLRKAIDGLVTMSNELDLVFKKMFDNKVPDSWAKVSYPSLKPLGSWVNNFLERIQFLQNWIDNGAPSTFWLSGFFFTQSFLSGVTQNYARKYKIPIDTLTYDFAVIPFDSPNYDLTKPPEDGCYSYGLFLDGAKWDNDNCIINEQDPKVLYVKMPHVHMIPTQTSKLDTKKIRYVCPVYKTSVRRGTLSTTGHSTNFVMYISLPISLTTTPDYWCQRGVALLSSLDD